MSYAFNTNSSLMRQIEDDFVTFFQNQMRAGIIWMAGSVKLATNETVLGVLYGTPAVFMHDCLYSWMSRLQLKSVRMSSNNLSSFLSFSQHCVLGGKWHHHYLAGEVQHFLIVFQIHRLFLSYNWLDSINCGQYYSRDAIFGEHIHNGV